MIIHAIKPVYVGDAGDTQKYRADRLGVTGLRPSPLPHHRTCSFPHPAVEPSDFMLSQNRMEPTVPIVSTLHD